MPERRRGKRRCRPGCRGCHHFACGRPQRSNYGSGKRGGQEW